MKKMKDYLTKFILMGLISLSLQSCREEAVPEPFQVISLDNVVSASYNDLEGAYSLEISGGGYSMKMEFLSGNDGIVCDFPVPATGVYSTDSPGDMYKITELSLVGPDGVCPVSGNMISMVASDDGTCIFNGDIYDDDFYFCFKTSELSFRHEVEDCIILNSADFNFTQNLFSLDFEDGNGGVLSVFLRSGQVDGNVVPCGIYSSDEGTLDLEKCVWKDVNGEHVIAEAVCVVAVNEGLYDVYGAIRLDDGSASRFKYNGLLLPDSYADGMIYTALGGEWQMTTDRWLVYDSDEKEWKYSDEGDVFRMYMSGMPEYGCFLASGIFDDSFSLFVAEKDGKIYIPCDVVSNPVAQVSSGGKTYHLFATLYDPETGYFVSEGNVDLVLQPDYSGFSVSAAEAEVVDEEGDKVKVEYSYFGLIGRNISSGAYTLFSNWPFVHLPEFSRPDAVSSDDVNHTPSNNVLPVKYAKVTETLEENSSMKIIPIEKQPLTIK